MLPILSPSQLCQPSKGLIIEDHEIGGHPILGAAIDLGGYLQQQLGELPKVLYPNCDNSQTVRDFDLQRNGLFDPFDCVTASHQGMIYNLHAASGWGDLPIHSRRFTAVDSGTKPRVGNSEYNVEQSIVRGMVAETAYVSLTPTMTEAEFFQPIPKAVYALEDFKNNYSIQFCKVPTLDGISARSEYVGPIMQYSPVGVCVDGNYAFDNEGRVIRTMQGDTHMVYLVSLPYGAQQYYLVMDSENAGGFVKFSPNYDFHYPIFGYLKKKVSYQLVKEAGSPAVYLYATQLDRYFPISDSSPIPDGQGSTIVILGGAILQTCSGTYKNAGIQHVPTIDHNKIIGKLTITI